MKLGEWTLDLVTDGLFGLDGGAMYGVVPRPLWEKKTPPDERNRIRMAMNCWLVRGRGATILIETGGGDKWDARHVDIYKFETGNRLIERLRQKDGLSYGAGAGVSIGSRSRLAEVHPP